MKNNFKTIGILGGMGPAASAAFHNSLIKQSQKLFNSIEDSDYPTIISYDIHLKDFDNTGQLDNGNTLNELLEGSKKLESFGAEIIVMACNTVHYFYDDIQSQLKSKLINMVTETSTVVANSNIKTIGILSSAKTNSLNLYKDALENKSLDTATANEKEQDILNEIILNVMGGKNGEEDKNKLLGIIEKFKQRGVQGVVLGCTELPLAISAEDTNMKLFNTIDIAAKAALYHSIIEK